MNQQQFTQHNIAKKIVSSVLFTVATLISCTKSDIGINKAPDIEILYMNDTTINETDKKTTAIENRTLRFDAEPHGNYRISNERLLNSVISFKYDNTTYSNTPISLFNSEITIKGCKPLRNNNITYTEDYRKAIQPVVVEFKRNNTV